MAGLAACDGQSTDNTTSAAKGSTPVEASVPAGENISLLNGKVTFTLPAGLTDQSGKLGSQSNSMHVYANKSGQQAIIVIMAPLPADSLSTLSGRLVEQQKSRDPSLNVLSDKSIEVSGQQAQEVNSLQTAKGQVSYSSIVLAKAGDQLMTMQVSLPGENQQEAANIANGVINTLKITE
ncbi:MAG: DcrB family lipoprotein [Enterobacterales bacterium]|nr:DcrB family lipoprotein [Enterobacterales bacterium]